ncbi:calcineurin regulatory subunit B [Planoprotostelium fungivorum]|uniref:Calcineurin regulatory subunit B n=1 Tax=Planoprotostelium fungivorum TaxID=1890364 RepID=A0A2P6NUH5_9EUKA|nr:calcineurin regulatory subunit B [Planoprotostelium fungivorum]
MGANTSSLTLSEIEYLQKYSDFSQMEIKRLYSRFRKLDRDFSGRISTESFMNIPELAMNPLAPRIIACFDSNFDDQISFKQFVEVLSVFNSGGKREDKIKLLFNAYDIKGDHFIDSEELEEIMKMMVGSHLSEDEIKKIVDDTIKAADKDGDGKISYEEFEQSLADSDIEKRMSLQVLKPKI